MRLYALDPDGSRLLDPDLASGARDRWSELAYGALLREPARVLELDALDELLDRVIRDTERFDAGIDRVVAPSLHRALPLTRREASDPGVWRFLTVVHRPDFVRHRWEYRSWAAMRARFWRPGTRPDSNALSRLWWIAELSREGDDYTLTERLLERQPLANNLFTRDLSAYWPVVKAYVEVLGDAPSPVLEVVIRALTRRLSTVMLESRDVEQLTALLTAIRDRALHASG